MDLPLRPKSIIVPVDPDGKIRFHLRPMDDLQLLVLAGVDIEKIGQDEQKEIVDEVKETSSVRVFELARNAHGGLKKVLSETLIRVEDEDDPNGLTVDGGPFEPDNEQHFFALPFLWRVKLLEGMVSQGHSMTKKMVGNSEGQDTRLEEASALTAH